MQGSMWEAPVLVTGPDRSGTSLLYALLASHSSISMVRRTNMWRWFRGRYGDLAHQENFERCLTTMLRYERLSVLEPDEKRIRAEFRDGEPSYGRLFGLLHRQQAERRGKRRWGDKSLHTEHYADQVFADFPEAKMIHLLRDPRDRHASITNRYEGEGKGIAAATGGWVRSTQVGERNQQRYPDRYLIVRYEDLARDPEITLREVCAFIDEPYEPSMLAMDGAPDHGAIGGNSSFGAIEPATISTRSIGRFRSVVADRDVAFIQIACRRPMKSHGYPIEASTRSFAERGAWMVGYIPVNLVRLGGWLVAAKVKERRGENVPGRRLAQAGR